jgi:hypothetical protein
MSNKNRNELSEVLRRQVRGARETSRSLGQTLVVTLRLPKKTLTPGTLQPKKISNRRGSQSAFPDDAVKNEDCT